MENDFIQKELQIQELSIKIGETLLQHHATMATAESCTGGNIARSITAVAGSSRYFWGAVVAYSNQIKTSVLHVSPETIACRGAVSRETVVEMVNGVRRLMQVDYAVSISGIAGPDGGTPAKPIGTVWIAVASANKVESRLFTFSEVLDRQQIVAEATAAALQLLLKFME